MTGKKRVLGSDLKKVDRHVIQPHEYDEVPGVDPEEIAERADLYKGGKLIRRGRPKPTIPSNRLPCGWMPPCFAGFKQSGPGYQSRIGAALKLHLTRKKAAAKASSRGKTVGKKKAG